MPAMLLVLLFHVVDNTAGQRLWHLPGAGPLIANASVALTLFFFLSGFVLTLGWSPRTATRAFYVRRFARIYPLYAVAWVFAVLVRYVREDQLPDAGVAIATLLLVQAMVPLESYQFGVDIVFWSLSCEVLFYLVLPCLLPRLASWTPSQIRVALLGCFVWLAAVPLVVYPFAGAHGLRVLTQFPLYRGAEFLAGVLACRWVLSGARPRLTPRVASVWALVAFGLSGIVLAALDQRGVPSSAARLVGMVGCSPAVALLVVALATADLDGVRGRFTGRAWVALGDWTYPIYLLHFPVLLALYPPFTRDSGWQGRGQLVLYLLLLVPLAGLAHRVVLRPMEAAIKRRWLVSRQS